MTHNNRGMENRPLSTDSQLPRILTRPAGQLRALPVRYRWEVTRRHPYYLMVFMDDFKNSPFGDVNANQWPLIKLALLGAIGVSGPIVPPDTSFEDLRSQAGQSPPAWLFSSVQPLSMRGLVGLLLTHLSPDSRRKIAESFRLSVEGAEDQTKSRFQALLHLKSLECADLDTFADQPIVAVSPVHTVNAVMTDIRCFLDDWRERHGLEEQRVRVDKFEEYLAVWDAREGWTGSGYTIGETVRMIEVAKQLGIPQSTAMNQYRAAFELITGNSYSSTRWVQICGPLKFPNDVMVDISQANMRRRLLPRGARPPVPESNLTGKKNRSSITGQSPASNNCAIEMWEILEDFQTLQKQGRSNESIAKELGMRPDSVKLLRKHLEEE